MSNSRFLDEKLINDYLSGIDEFKKPAENPGFFVVGAQNPPTFKNREVLSKALENRLITQTLPDLTINELREVLTKKFKFSEPKIEKRLAQYEYAKNEADKQRFFPAPDSRTVVDQAVNDEKKLRVMIQKN